MANTTRGIPYPNDYNAAADVPAALQNLAVKVDELVGTVDIKATSATSNANAANTAASNASAAVAAHTHNGSGSVNIALTAVTGLSSALSSKSDTTHTHTGTYSPADHTHTAAELAAHTHSDYAPTSHTHTQASSHVSADTDTATGIHHTIGTGSNQAAPGNHAHSGYSTTDHTHAGYAASTHSHGEYSVSGHTHNYADTNHTHTGYASSSHTHPDPTSLSLQTIYVVGAGADFPGVVSNSTTGINTVGITGGGRLRMISSSQDIKYDIATLTGTLSTTVDRARLNQVETVNPEAILDVAVVEYSLIDDGQATTHRQLGFIAEDVNAKLPVAVSRDLEGKPAGVLDTPLIAAILAVVQQQQQHINGLETRLHALEQA